MAKRFKHRRDPAKERHWRAVIRRWDRSGQTIVEFCRQADVKMPNFFWWRRELAKRDRLPLRRSKHRRSPDRGTRAARRPTGASALFIPVRLRAPMAAAAGDQGIEIVLADGRLVRVGCAASRELLSNVMAVLESR